MKNLIKKISILLILNSYAFCDVQIKTDYDSYSMNPLLGSRVENEILGKIRYLKFDNQKFTLKTKCMVNSLGVFNYRFISESQSESGYENKVLIMNELEKLKKHSFIDEMKSIQKIKKDYEYKDLSFEFEVISN